MSAETYTDKLFDGLNLVATGNSPFDQILWDAARSVLSFRRSGQEEYVNLWLDDGQHGDEHLLECNGSAAADSEVLWSAWHHVTVDPPGDLDDDPRLWTTP